MAVRFVHRVTLRAILEWAFAKTSRVLFFPDQHLGRNTALKMGVTEDQMPLWNPHDDDLGGELGIPTWSKVRVILWQGHCSVHQMFQRPEHVANYRKEIPGIKILVHPECRREVNDLADVSGLDRQDHQDRRRSPLRVPSGAIGTELHLVNRLKAEHPDQEIHFLSPTRLHVCNHVSNRSSASLLVFREFGERKICECD